METQPLAKQKIYWLGIAAWTCLLSLSLGWSSYSEYQETLESARTEVRAYHNSMSLFRGWVARHGGVYAPVSDETPPNPLLAHIKERDLETQSGVQLTLINPAYMTRQLHKDLQEKMAIAGKLTSLKPINEKNSPDAWEKAALEAFEQGSKEKSEISLIDGQPYMRIIRPLHIEAACLGCHAEQGYLVGDIRGGLSTSVSMDSHLAIGKAHIINITIAHLGIWGVGLLGIFLASRALVSSRRKLEISYQDLKKNEARLSESQRIARIGNWEWDIESGALYWSDEIYRIFSTSVTSFTPTLEGFMERVHPEDRDIVQKRVQASLNHESATYELEHRIILPGGEEKKLYERGKVFFDQQDRPVRMVGTVRDISQEWRAEKEQQRTNAAEQMLNALSKLSLQPLELKDFLSEALDLFIDSALIPNCTDKAVIYLIDEDTQQGLHIQAHKNLSDGDRARYHYLPAEEGFWHRVLQQQGIHYLPQVEPSDQVQLEGLLDGGLYAAPLLSHQQGMGVIALGTGINHTSTDFDKTLIRRVANVLSLGIARRFAEQETQHQAYHDLLTGLPNRRLMHDRLIREVGLAKRHQYCAAVLFLDLDHFKKINDALGHAIGDQVLKEAANRIKNCLRKEDTAARIGGDEFIVLLTSLQGNTAQVVGKANYVAEKIKSALSSPFEVDNQVLHVTVSIGVAIYPDHHDNADALIRHADTSMYKAKQGGRDTVCFFNPSMQKEATDRLEIESDLRAALKNNEFSLAYQPQIDKSGQVLGAEALLRWNQPTRGFVSPADFIPIAEDVGLIIPIGNWVMREAMLQAKTIQNLAGQEGQPLHMAINISQVQFKGRDFVHQVTTLLNETGVNPSRIELEITEGMLIEDIAGTIEKMKALKVLGINFSVDDFGTGYSSLSYLKQLPLDKLKIDQSFVRDVDKSKQDAGIVEAIISMAKHLGMDLIAEGVETEQERDFLAAKGCDKYQGYYYFKPMPGTEYQEMLESELVNNTASIN